MVPSPPKFPMFFRRRLTSVILSNRYILSDPTRSYQMQPVPPSPVVLARGGPWKRHSTRQTPSTIPNSTRTHAAIMVSRRNKTLASLSLFLAVWAWNVSAAAVKGETAAVDLSSLTAPQIEEQLQVPIDPVSRVQYHTRANRC